LWGRGGEGAGWGGGGDMPARQRFFVDLKDGETTVVSWKKLTNDAEKNMSAGVPSDAPAGANPALEARIAPEVQVGIFCCKF